MFPGCGLISAGARGLEEAGAETRKGAGQPPNCAGGCPHRPTLKRAGRGAKPEGPTNYIFFAEGAGTRREMFAKIVGCNGKKTKELRAQAISEGGGGGCKKKEEKNKKKKTNKNTAVRGLSLGHFFNCNQGLGLISRNLFRGDFGGGNGPRKTPRGGGKQILRAREKNRKKKKKQKQKHKTNKKKKGEKKKKKQQTREQILGGGKPLVFGGGKGEFFFFFCCRGGGVLFLGADGGRGAPKKVFVFSLFDRGFRF